MTQRSMMVLALVTSISRLGIAPVRAAPPGFLNGVVTGVSTPDGSFRGRPVE